MYDQVSAATAVLPPVVATRHAQPWQATLVAVPGLPPFQPHRNLLSREKTCKWERRLGESDVVVSGERLMFERDDWYEYLSEISTKRY